MSTIATMIAELRKIAAVPDRAAVICAAGLQSSMDAASSAKGRALTGTAEPTSGGIAISVRTNGRQSVGDKWETIIADGIDAAWKEAT